MFSLNVSFCANCGKELCLHSETQTDRCLKDLNGMVIELYEFDKKLELEGESQKPTLRVQPPVKEVDICG